MCKISFLNPKEIFQFCLDPRTLDWWLIKDPFGIFGIIGVYLFFVLKLGPWLMKDRKPMQLKNTLIVYNFFQVLLSVYLFVEVFQNKWS